MSNTDAIRLSLTFAYLPLAEDGPDARPMISVMHGPASPEENEFNSYPLAPGALVQQPEVSFNAGGVITGIEFTITKPVEGG